MGYNAIGAVVVTAMGDGNPLMPGEYISAIGEIKINSVFKIFSVLGYIYFFLSIVEVFINNLANTGGLEGAYSQIDCFVFNQLVADSLCHAAGENNDSVSSLDGTLCGFNPGNGSVFGMFSYRAGIEHQYIGLILIP